MFESFRVKFHENLLMPTCCGADGESQIEVISNRTSSVRLRFRPNSSKILIYSGSGLCLPVSEVGYSQAAIRAILAAKS